MNHTLTLGAVCYQEYSGDYLQFLRLAGELDLAWVEFKYEPPLSGRDGSLRYGDIRRLATELGIGLSMHTAFDRLNIADLDDGKRALALAAVNESIDAAGEMGITLATVHPGHLLAADYSSEHWTASGELNIQSLRLLVAYAAERGITLCLENSNAFKRSSVRHGAYPGDLKFIRCQVGDQLAYTVDFGHALFLSEDPSFLVTELGQDVVRLAHIHSNDGMSDTHSPLNTGVLRLRRIVERAGKERWDFPVSIEMKTEANLRRSVETFRKVAADFGVEVASRQE